MRMEQTQLHKFSEVLYSTKVYNYAECIVGLAPIIVSQVASTNQRIVAKLLGMTEPKLSGLLPVLMVLADRQDATDLEVHTSSGIYVIVRD